MKKDFKNDFKKTFGNTVEGGAAALVISGFYSRKPVICFEQAGLLTLSLRFNTFPWFTVVFETIPPGLGRQWKLQQRVLFRDYTGFPFNSGRRSLG